VHDNEEPSVEEILASIKKVMAADSQIAKNATKPSKSRPSFRAISSDDDDSILELDAFHQSNEDNEAEGESADSLVSENNVDMMRSSLAALSTLSEPGKAPQIVRSGETSLEEMVREMLRPMLKEWLDENLPPLVEQMVAGEIARITRKGK